jgi:hypothetical protein
MLTSIKAVSLKTGIPETQLVKLVKSGDIPHVRLPNGTVRITLEDALQWIEQNKTKDFVNHSFNLTPEQEARRAAGYRKMVASRRVIKQAAVDLGEGFLLPIFQDPETLGVIGPQMVHALRIFSRRPVMTVSQFCKSVGVSVSRARGLCLSLVKRGWLIIAFKPLGKVDNYGRVVPFYEVTEKGKNMLRGWGLLSDEKELPDEGASHDQS